jgi:hypothetical protein
MRRHRAFAAVLAILALLFSQLAVSAFACPRIEAVVAAVQMPEGHCEKQQPNVCHEHCEYGAATVNQVSPDLAPDVLALPLPWRADPRLVLAPVVGDPVRRHDFRSHSPPPLALFGALRI